jgi:hypothetical protein
LNNWIHSPDLASSAIEIVEHSINEKAASKIRDTFMVTFLNTD